MATNDPEFYQSPKFTPEPPMAAPRQRGCFFYGCIIASVLVLLVAIMLAMVAYFAYRGFNQLVDQYTATVPRELPAVEMAPEKRQAVKDRVVAFGKAVEEGTPTEPLELTSDDLNALIEENTKLKGKIYVKIEGKEIKGQVSYPFDALPMGPFRGMLQGRYLNAEVALKASLEDGLVLVTLDSVEVNGKSPPENVMTNLRQQNLAKDVFDDPKAAAILRKLESLEVKDGKIIIKVRARSETSTGAQSKKKDLPIDVLAPSAKPDQPKTEPVKLESPEPKPAPPNAPRPESKPE